MKRENDPTSVKHGSFKALVAMQLRAALSFSFKVNKKAAILKLTLFLLGIAAMTGFLFLLNFVLGYLRIFGLSDRIPIPLWNVFFFGYLLFSFFSCLFRLNDALYFSDDNPILLVFPVSHRKVFLSKLVVFGIQELLRNCFFLLPLLLSVGLSYSVSFPFYLWALLMTAVLALLPVAVSAFLSVPFYHVRVYFRRHPLLQNLSLLALLVLGTILVFYVTTLIPENLDLVAKWGNVYLPAILDWLSLIAKVLFPLLLLSVMAIGYDPFSVGGGAIGPFWWLPPIILFVVIALVVGCAVGSAFLVSKRYPVLATSSREFKKVQKVGKTNRKNRRIPSFFSYLRKGIYVEFRSSQALVGNYCLFVVTPLATLLLNVVFSAMHKSYNGELLTLLFNGLLIALIMLTTNVSAASVYSQDGEAGLFEHVAPRNLLSLLLSKLALRAFIMTASLIFTIVVYAQRCSLSFVPMPTLFVCFYSVYIGHLLWSAEMDYMSPKIQTRSQGNKRLSINMNEFKSTVFALLISVLFGAILYLLAAESAIRGFNHLLVACLLFVAARIFLFVHKVRSYGLLPYEGRGDK